MQLFALSLVSFVMILKVIVSQETETACCEKLCSRYQNLTDSYSIEDCTRSCMDCNTTVLVNENMTNTTFKRDCQNDVCATKNNVGTEYGCYKNCRVTWCEDYVKCPPPTDPTPTTGPPPNIGHTKSIGREESGPSGLVWAAFILSLLSFLGVIGIGIGIYFYIKNKGPPTHQEGADKAEAGVGAGEELIPLQKDVQKEANSEKRTPPSPSNR